MATAKQRQGTHKATLIAMLVRAARRTWRGYPRSRKRWDSVGIGRARPRAGLSCMCAEHVRQLGCGRPLHNLMEVKS
jgi:hypothetical protein